VLLKNDRNLLLALFAGDARTTSQATGVGRSAGKLGNANADFPGATSIFEGIRATVTLREVKQR